MDEQMIGDPLAAVVSRRLSWPSLGQLALLTLLAPAFSAGCAAAPAVEPLLNLLERDFYVVAHRANSTSAVEQALANGANAIELDIRVHRNQFCANHDPVSIFVPCEPLDALLEFIKAKVTANRKNGRQRLGLIFYDFKNDGDLESAGGILLELIRTHLTDSTELKTLISIADLGDSSFLAGAYRNLRSGEALAVDYDDDPDAVSEFFNRERVDNFAYGDGCCVVCVCPAAKTAIERAVSLREKLGEIKLVYIWTLGRKGSMREFIDLGVDAIFVNGGWVLGTKNDLPVLLRQVAESSRVRLAPPDYNPFP